MSDAPPKTNEHAVAQQTQEKFELYLLSLVFTLLALAIQTATFGPSLAKSMLELLAWLCLLISGLAGLWRLQWVPVLRVQMANRRSIKDEILKLKELEIQGQTELLVLESGTRQPISKRLVHRNAALAVYDPLIAKLEQRVFVAYDIHQYSFALGLVVAVVARGFEPALAIAKYLSALFP